MNSSDQPPRQKEGWFSKLLMLLVILALFGIPVTYYVFEPERAQWSAAQAIRKYNDGDKEEAMELLTAAIVKADDPSLELRLAKWKQQEGQYDEALVHCEDLIERVKVNGDQLAGMSSLGAQAMLLKTDCLLLKGKKWSAFKNVRDTMKLPAIAGQSSVRKKNMLAYYRSLCGRELPAADRDMLSVINELGGGDTKYPITFPGEVCMAAGMISRYTGQQELALQMLDIRLSNLSQRQSQIEKTTNKVLYQLLKSQLDPLNMALYNQANRAREESGGLKNEFAVLYTVQALLLEEVGKPDEAMIARNRVSNLGFDPSEVLETLPHERFCLGILEEGQTYLDTRGYVLLKRKKYERALEDLSIAIAAVEISLASFQTSVRNFTDMGDGEQWEERTRLTCAVLRNHRLELYEKTDAEDRAAVDRARIIDLGYEPGKKLF